MLAEIISDSLNMVNYLNQLENPQINHRVFFEVMRDFRKGGLNPENFLQFMEVIENLPPINERTTDDYSNLTKLGLIDVIKSDFAPIMKEVIKRNIEKSKKCWHPLASASNCKVDDSGNIIISAAHSIQNNGVLNQIAKDGFVTTYSVDIGEYKARKLRKNAASIFLGFCNIHDAIFRPIEVNPYTKTEEQNFLFAYRAFAVTAHKKMEVSNFIDFGKQADNDIIETKKIFDNAILSKDYSVIETSVIELQSFYPIAVSACFYIDFDFEGKIIPHSNNRMELIYVTLIPNVNKTYFLLSYLKTDSHLYGQLGTQLKSRNNIKSDISVLIASHVENIYYNPDYYKIFIEPQEKSLERFSMQTQFDFASIDDNDQPTNIISITPKNYLNNQYDISFFGY